MKGAAALELENRSKFKTEMALIRRSDGQLDICRVYLQNNDNRRLRFGQGCVMF